MFAQVKRVVGVVLVVAVSVFGAVGCAPAGETNSGGSRLTAGPVVTPSLPAATPVVPPPIGVTSAGIPDVVQAIPLAARQRTAAGAEAFVRYYLTILNQAGTQPRRGLFEPLSTDQCRTCAGFAQNTADLMKDSERYAGPPTKWTTVAGLDGFPETSPRYSVGARIQEGEHPIVNGAGKVVQTIEPHESTLVFELIWVGDRWKTDKIKLLQAGEK